MKTRIFAGTLVVAVLATIIGCTQSRMSSGEQEFKGKVAKYDGVLAHGRKLIVLASDNYGGLSKGYRKHIADCADTIADLPEYLWLNASHKWRASRVVHEHYQRMYMCLRRSQARLILERAANLRTPHDSHLNDPASTRYGAAIIGV